MSHMHVTFTPPPGYAIYVGGVLTSDLDITNTSPNAPTVTEVTGSTSTIISKPIMLRPVSYGDMAGASSGLQVRDVVWKAGLGHLLNGDGAGLIVMHQGVFSAGVFYRSALNYMRPSPEVTVKPDNYGLRQILAPEAFVNVSDLSGGVGSGYQLDFYAPSVVTGTTSDSSIQDGTGVRYTFSGTPFKSYVISKDGTTNHIKVTQSSGSFSVDTVAVYDSSGATSWSTSYGGLKTETRTNSIVSGDRVETVLIKEANGTQTAKTINTYHTYSWDEELIKTVVDPDGQAYTTTYSYYDGVDAAVDGKLQTVVQPSGSWVHYDYYTSSETTLAKRGQIHHIYRSRLDGTLPGSFSESSGDVTIYDYDGGWDYQTPLLNSQVRQIDNVVVAKTTCTNSINNVINEAKVWIQTRNDYSDATHYLTTVTKTYQPNQSSAYAFYNGKPYSVKYPNGRVDAYIQIQGTYSSGSFSPGSGPDGKEIALHGVDSSVTNSDAYPGYSGTTVETVYLVRGQSTETVSYQQHGVLVQQDSVAWLSGSTPTVGSTTFTYSSSGKLTGKTSSNGATYTAHYTNEFMDYEIDETGIKTSYTPDALQRVSVTTKTAGSGYSYTGVVVPSGDITTTYTYDALNHATTVVSAGTSVTSLTTTSTYNQAGQIVSSVAPGSYTTGYSYNSNAKIQTITSPGGATKIIESYADGETKSVTGTAQIASYYGYNVESNGNITTTVHAQNGSSGAWQVTQVDWLGRKVLDRQPDIGGNNVDTTYSYNSKGQLWKTATTGPSGTDYPKPTLYGYNDMGDQTVTALDVANADTIDYGGTDRISKTETTITYDGTNYWATTTKSVYETDNSGTATTGATPVQTSAVRLTGYSGNTRAVATTTDANNLVTIQTTVVDSSARTVTVTTDVPDSGTDAVQVSYNGLPVRSINPHGLETTVQYDGFGRAVQTNDPRKGGVVTVYSPSTGQVQETKFASGVTIASYYYDNAGRVNLTVDAGTHGVYVSYNTRGQVEKQWGDGTLPVKYDYDLFGRLQYQSTYRGGTGTMWTDNAWPSSPSTADVTTFYYSSDLPLLSEKRDATWNASTKPNARTAYTYDSLGRVKTRTNGRGTVTTYVYDDPSGALTDTTYSDGITPAIAMDYNRLGLVKTVIDGTGVSGSNDAARTRTFTYGTDLQLTSEGLPAFYNNTSSVARQITYNYATSGVIGRLTGMDLGTSSTHAADQTSAYAYKADGRVDTIGGHGNGLTNYDFAYSYKTNSDNLISGVANTATGYAQTRDYYATRDAVTQLITQYGTGPGSIQTQYDYNYNDLGQRTTAKQSGAAYADIGAATYYRYTYDGRGQVVSANARYGDIAGSDEASDTNPALAGRTYGYTYDNAGNRASGNHTLSPTLADAFTANSLNQITNRENHAISVQGTYSGTATGIKVLVAGNDGASTVDNVAGGNTGNYWGAEGMVANGSGAIQQTIGIKAVGTVSGSTLATGTTKSVFMPKASEDLTYDIDGNLTADGHWTYTWDAENRLIGMATNPNVFNSSTGAYTTTGSAASPAAGSAAAALAAVSPSLPQVRLTFTYDYLGRRVSRKIEDYSGGSWATRATDATHDGELRFIYNGWNVIAELKTDGTILRHFIWGLDLSGTTTGMGGIGALLTVQDNGASYFPAYDGSGNVAAMIKSDGTLVATYEYSPFGELIRADGTYAAINRFRSCTKYTDEDTGLVYYGHRYYSPSLGRFINRDPSGENGGINLYGFCGNNGINAWDYLGLDPQADWAAYSALSPSQRDDMYGNSTLWNGMKPDNVGETGRVGTDADLWGAMQNAADNMYAAQMAALAKETKEKAATKLENAKTDADKVAAMTEALNLLGVDMTGGDNFRLKATSESIVISDSTSGRDVVTFGKDLMTGEWGMWNASTNGYDNLTQTYTPDSAAPIGNPRSTGGAYTESDLVKIINSSSIGSSVYNLTKPTITLYPNRTGTYSNGTNIYVGTDGKNLADAAEEAAHELGHAFQSRYHFNQGNVWNQNRQDFINTWLKNEAVAETLAMLIHFELQNQVSAPSNAATWRAMPSNQKMPYLMIMYATTYTTSTTGQQYTDYYGSFWDKNHKH
ncbi:MAG: hypothetical protein JSS11_16380 [Verrucomicrobia bacterium]|nr:hypothetical protein [Verrucomicrobiota bacterium]